MIVCDTVAGSTILFVVHVWVYANWRVISPEICDLHGILALRDPERVSQSPSLESSRTTEVVDPNRGTSKKRSDPLSFGIEHHTSATP